MAGKTRSKRSVQTKRQTPRERLAAESATKPPAKSRGRASAAPEKRRLGRRRKAAPVAREQRTSGRYTAPIPRAKKRSPRWFPWVILSLLLVGVLLIILDYIQVLPSSPTNWYIVGGLVSIVAGALMATSYR